MVARETEKKGLYVGTGIGLVLFALIGILPGSFIGGMVGLKIATNVFGTPLSASLLPKVIVGVSMLFGVAMAGVIFIVGASLLGWAAGHVLNVARYSKERAHSVAESK